MLNYSYVEIIFLKFDILFQEVCRDKMYAGNVIKFGIFNFFSKNQHMNLEIKKFKSPKKLFYSESARSLTPRSVCKF